jgi:hypothetical protein
MVSGGKPSTSRHFPSIGQLQAVYFTHLRTLDVRRLLKQSMRHTLATRIFIKIQQPKTEHSFFGDGMIL